MKYGYVYLLANKNNTTLYVGVTSDLIARVLEHKNKLYKGFTSKYNVDKLVYFEEFDDIEQAIDREKNLKNWKRSWKDELIAKENAEWCDLSEGWYHDNDLI